MNKFTYLTKSRDGKMSGVVDAKYMSDVLTGRSIKMIGDSDESPMFQFSLSDGGFVRIKIAPESPEIHYYSPSNR